MNSPHKLLYEIQRVRQVAGEPRRRWFMAMDMDLIVWYDEANEPVAFQLCYDKTRKEHALTWKRGRGFSHLAVDSGESNSLSGNMTPILVANGRFDPERIRQRFEAASSNLPQDIIAFVGPQLALCVCPDSLMHK